MYIYLVLLKENININISNCTKRTFMGVLLALLSRWFVLFSSVDGSYAVFLFFAFCISQVFMEFSRIVGKNLKMEFYESLDEQSPRLLELFRTKRGNVGQLLTQLSQQTNVRPSTLWAWYSIQVL